MIDDSGVDLRPEPLARNLDGIGHLVFQFLMAAMRGEEPGEEALSRFIDVNVGGFLFIGMEKESDSINDVLSHDESGA
jgi:hypothetical protein